VTEAEWLTADRYPLLKELGCGGSDRKARLLACAWCRLFWDAFHDRRSRTAVEKLERYADEPRNPGLRTLARNIARKAFPRSSSTTNCGFWAAQVVLIAAESAPSGVMFGSMYPGLREARGMDADAAHELLFALVAEVFGSSPQPEFASEWRTDTAVALARTMYESRDFGAMPILADALQDAGCDNDDILTHCRGDGPHVRGCWVVDLVLGKE
jgi:hypothetical protein